MTWFAAHIVMSVKLHAGRQAQFPAWENIVLIEAASTSEAMLKAEQIGREQEGDDDGTFSWGGRPAEWIFVGIRKLTECALSGARPEHGDEITYSELLFASRQALTDFAAGLPADARHEDRFIDGERDDTGGAAKKLA